MRLLHLLLMIVFLLGSAYAQQNSASQNSGNVSFSAPQGWVRANMQGGVQFNHKNAAGNIDGVILIGQDMPVPANPADWIEQKALSFLEGEPIREQAVQAEKLATGLTSTYKVLVGGTEQQPMFYVVALLHNSTTGVLVALLTSESSKLEAFAKEMDAVAASVKFTGTPAAAGQAQAQAPVGAGTPAGTASQLPQTGLPEVKPMNAAQFRAAGGDPDKQFIPDEFRCYIERKGEGLTPELTVQILAGGQYRTKYGNGTLKVNQDGSLRKIVGASGPLAGATGYLNFGNYGQQFELNDVGETDDERGVDLQCYQRGPRENQALFYFKLRTPKTGQYPCTLNDGKGTAQGTLSIQPSGVYALGGQTGRFTTDYRSKQDDDSSLDFTGGLLDDRLGSYTESEYGLREFSFTRPNMTCKALVTPTPFPSRYGVDKAPAPSKGSGGLSGNWVHSRAGQLIPGLQMGPNFTSTMVLNSECPGNMCWDFLFFNKNGYVYTLEPDESLAEADCSRTYPNGLPICEVYRVSGNSIQIGNDKAVPFKQAKTFILDGREYDPLMPLDGLKLGGSFKSTVVSNAILSLGGSISYTSLYFNSKNQFAYNYNSSTNLAGSGYVASASSQDATRWGTYQFKGNTLELKSPDGRVTRMFAVTMLDDKGKLYLGSLRLGGSTYILEAQPK